MDVPTLVQKTVVKKDNFKKTTLIHTIGVVYADNRMSLDQSSYSLEARMNDGETEPRFFVALETMRSQKRDWAIWREAFDEDGNKFPIDNDERKAIPVPQVQDMALQEISTAPVTREYLERVKSKEIKWKIYGDSTSEQFTLSSKLVEAFLIKCDQVLTSNTKPKSTDGL